MPDRIRDAFDKIRADQELKDRTAAFAAEEIHRRSRGKKILPIRRIVSLAAALTVLLLGAGFLRSYYTVSAAISVDADASLKLEVNCFDRVISVEGYGEEGQALAEDLDLKHRSYRAALETLLNSRKLREQLSRLGGHCTAGSLWGGLCALPQELTASVCPSEVCILPRCASRTVPRMSATWWRSLGETTRTRRSLCRWQT